MHVLPDDIIILQCYHHVSVSLQGSLEIELSLHFRRYSLLQMDSVHSVQTEVLDWDFGPAEILTHSVTEKSVAIAHRSPTLEESSKQLSRSYLIHLSN